MTVPAPGVSLEAKREVTRRLLRADADIHAVNCVRKHLSDVKGGRLAAASAGATVTLAISDVVGDDTSVIGSGPTVADPTTFGEALAVILDACGGRRAFPARCRRVAGAGRRRRRLRRRRSPATACSRTPSSMSSGRGADASRRNATRHNAWATACIAAQAPVVGEARARGSGARRVAGGAGAEHAGPLCVVSARRDDRARPRQRDGRTQSGIRVGRGARARGNRTARWCWPVSAPTASTDRPMPRER